MGPSYCLTGSPKSLQFLFNVTTRPRIPRISIAMSSTRKGCFLICFDLKSPFIAWIVHTLLLTVVSDDLCYNAAHVFVITPGYVTSCRASHDGRSQDVNISMKRAAIKPNIPGIRNSLNAGIYYVYPFLTSAHSNIGAVSLAEKSERFS